MSLDRPAEPAAFVDQFEAKDRRIAQLEAELAGVKKHSSMMGREWSKDKSKRDRAINQNVELRKKVEGLNKIIRHNMDKLNVTFKKVAELEPMLDENRTMNRTHYALLVEAADVLEEAQREIEHWHGESEVAVVNYLSEEERNHPRGSGWARVYDKIHNMLVKMERIHDDETVQDVREQP